MKDYIIKFERLYKKLERKGMKLPDIMLAYRIMKSANLGKDETLVKVTVGSDTMTYIKMKSTLLSISDGIVQTSRYVNVSPKIKLVKEEPAEVLYQEGHLNDYGLYDDNSDDYEDDFSEELGVDETYYQHQSRLPRRTFTPPGTSYRGRKNQMNSRGSYHARRGRYAQPSGSNSHGKLNRQDSSGKVTGCKICCSIYHWAVECPHKGERQQTNSNSKPEAILKLDCLFMDHEDDLCYLTSQSKNVALIDCGAAKTVVGKKWFEIFENSLSEEERECLKEERNVRHFKFGDGDTVRSEVVKVIPLNMCGQKMAIKANLVDNNVPLLISNQSLKDAKAKINFLKDTLEINGNSQKLISTTSGHYGIPVGHYERELEECQSNDATSEVFLEQT